MARSCRAPHQTITAVRWFGGGQVPTPGDVSLAPHGVLVLDELSAFRREVLKVFRQSLEERILYRQPPERPRPH
jgi:magnesium chelatase family protein